MSSNLADAQSGRQVAGSQRLAAVTAGLAYAVLIVLGLVFNFVVLGLIEPDDAATTVRHIADSDALFRTGLVAPWPPGTGCSTSRSREPPFCTFYLPRS